MSTLIIALFAIIGSTVFVDAQSPRKLVCVYNSTSIQREGLGKVTVADIEWAVAFCDVLIYGWAGIDPYTNKVRSLIESLDLDNGQGLYRQITNLKTKYPKLKVLLGVGGNADPNSEIYMQLLENQPAFAIFINSLYTLVKTYRFDGVDLAWQFKPNKPQRIRSGLGSLWYSTKKTLEQALDPAAEVHRNGFQHLVQITKDAFRPDNFMVTATVLPNVNTTLHYDVAGIIPFVDFVTLAAYDYQTWERNPHEADYPAPIYQPLDRIPESNVDFQVNLWLQMGAPANKLIVAIPTHGRTWQLTSESTRTGVPPIHEVEEPGRAGQLTQNPGFLSYPEVCILLPNPGNARSTGEQQPLRLVRDQNHQIRLPVEHGKHSLWVRKEQQPLHTHRFGSYAFRLPDENGNHGLWVGFEDPETAQGKANYITSKNLGGASILNLDTDDFRGVCTGDKYPILRATKYSLQQPN